MGREIRKVIPNWEHPKEEKYNSFKGRYDEGFKPLYNRPYRKSINEWITEHQLWEKGEHPDQQDKDLEGYINYADYAGNPPDVESYRPDWREEEMTWFQVYETVSEGTPVTPPFATREELVAYLVENGDFWDQERRSKGDSIMPCDPWPLETAQRFVFGSGYAPSLVVTDGKIQSGVEALYGTP